MVFTYIAEATASPLTWLVVLPVGSTCIAYLCTVGVALFHPRKQRRAEAIAVLDRIPTTAIGRKRNTGATGRDRRTLRLSDPERVERDTCR